MNYENVGTVTDLRLGTGNCYYDETRKSTIHCQNSHHGWTGGRCLSQRRDLVDAAHQLCSYSNATRGNIEVAINLI